jgi:UDPglucose--hexose-1-phosphate uridylyltransferase
MAFRAEETGPNEPGWQVRVVPNRFPALQPETVARHSGDGIYRAVGGHGAHEVIIETPRHLVSPTELTPEDFALVVRTYCHRARALSEQEGVSYVLIFKNVGEGAGASIEHTHSQLIAVPVMPKRVDEEMRRCAEFRAEHGRCLFCAMIEQEVESGQRVVVRREGFLVISAYAARFPFEMWVLPEEHQRHFHEMDVERAAALARVLQEALGRLEVCLRDPPFNYAIHSSPVGGEGETCYHWHIEVIPRVTRVAGFEWGSGFHINPMEPERAAEHLREVPEKAIKAKVTYAATPDR